MQNDMQIENLEQEELLKQGNAKLRVIVREEFDRKASRSFGVYNNEYDMMTLMQMLKRYLEERDAQ